VSLGESFSPEKLGESFSPEKLLFWNTGNPTFFSKLKLVHALWSSHSISRSSRSLVFSEGALRVPKIAALACVVLVLLVVVVVVRILNLT
jgi:hypothetical protein